MRLIWWCCKFIDCQRFVRGCSHYNHFHIIFESGNDIRHKKERRRKIQSIQNQITYAVTSPLFVSWQKITIIITKEIECNFEVSDSVLNLSSILVCVWKSKSVFFFKVVHSFFATIAVCRRFKLMLLYRFPLFYPVRFGICFVWVFEKRCDTDPNRLVCGRWIWFKRPIYVRRRRI